MNVRCFSHAMLGLDQWHDGHRGHQAQDLRTNRQTRASIHGMVELNVQPHLLLARSRGDRKVTILSTTTECAEERMP
jgi:hypothetical protein